MEIRRRQTSAQSASESAALGKAGHGSAETGRAVPSAQSKKEPLAALFLCAAARRIRGGTPHPPRQSRHLPPLGKAKDHFCFHAVCKVLTASVALQELYSDNLTRPSPAGEGGPRQRWMRCLRTAATGRRGTLAFRTALPQGKPEIRTLLRRLPLPHSTNWRNAVGSA